jgi:hypothetical protein
MTNIDHWNLNRKAFINSHLWPFMCRHLRHWWIHPPIESNLSIASCFLECGIINLSTFLLFTFPNHPLRVESRRAFHKRCQMSRVISYHRLTPYLKSPRRIYRTRIEETLFISHFTLLFIPLPRFA